MLLLDTMTMIFGFNSDVEPSRRNDLNVSDGLVLLDLVATHQNILTAYGTELI